MGAIFAKALGISIAIGAALYAISYFILVMLSGVEAGQATELAKGLGAIPVLGCVHIADMLERQRATKSAAPGHKTTIRTFEGFSISWPIMAVAGTIVLVAAAAFISFFGVVIADLLMSAAAPNDTGRTQLNQFETGAAGLIGIPFQLIGGYLLGKWIGTRCARNGIGVVILVAAIGAIAVKVGDYIIIPADDFYAMFGKEKTVASLIIPTLFIFGMWAVAGLLGYWRGRKQKISKYMNYLLCVLPADTRSTLVDLAFEEAKNVRSAPTRARPVH